MIDLKALETFIWVARQQSFRAAAERLNTTQPAISQRIAALEADLGVALLHRTTRRVVVTAKGRVLLEHAERLLALRSEMIAAIGDPSIRTGTFRLGVAETIVHTWLPRLIERTAQVFPRLALEIEVDTSPNLKARLDAREVDLAVLVGPVVDPALQWRTLCRYPMGFVASPKLALRQKRLTLEDLLRNPIVTFTRNTRPYADLTALIARAGVGPARIHASASLATIVRMAKDGLGIAVIPPVIVTEELARGRLLELATEDRLPDLAFVAAWLDSSDPDIVARVVELAEDVASQGGAAGGAKRGTLRRTRSADEGRRTSHPTRKAAPARSRPS